MSLNQVEAVVVCSLLRSCKRFVTLQTLASASGAVDPAAQNSIDVPHVLAGNHSRQRTLYRTPASKKVVGVSGNSISMLLLANSRAERAVRLGGGPAFWLVLIISSLTGDVYAQCAVADPARAPDFNCATSESVSLHQNQNDGLAACDESQSSERIFSSGAKAYSFCGLYGTTQVVPLQKPDFHHGLLDRQQPAAVKVSGITAGMSNPFRIGAFHSLTPGVSLWAQTQQTSTGDQKQTPPKKQSGTTSNSPGHIFWVVPAFKVDYGKGFKPLTTKEKFKEWARGAYDPLGLGAGAVEAATLEHSSSDGFCGYGPGWGGYGKCFGSLELDANVSSFIGDFVLTSWWHQDPRYFRLGEGSTGKRLLYAIERVFVTYNDSGHTVFYSSALTGTVVAAGVSNLYYPQKDRGFGHSVSRVAIDLGNTALYNAAAEFWPDIHRKLQHIF